MLCFAAQDRWGYVYDARMYNLHNFHTFHGTTGLIYRVCGPINTFGFDPVYRRWSDLCRRIQCSASHLLGSETHKNLSSFTGMATEYSLVKCLE